EPHAEDPPQRERLAKERWGRQRADGDAAAEDDGARRRDRPPPAEREEQEDARARDGQAAEDRECEPPPRGRHRVAAEPERGGGKDAEGRGALEPERSERVADPSGGSAEQDVVRGDEARGAERRLLPGLHGALIPQRHEDRRAGRPWLSQRVF